MEFMSMSELGKLLEFIKNSRENKHLFYPAKYIEPCIDTRLMIVFSIVVRTWSGKIYTLDYRDKSEHTSFYEYVMEKLNEDY